MIGFNNIGTPQQNFIRVSLIADDEINENEYRFIIVEAMAEIGTKICVTLLLDPDQMSKDDGYCCK